MQSRYYTERVLQEFSKVSHMTMINDRDELKFEPSYSYVYS